MPPYKRKYLGPSGRYRKKAKYNLIEDYYGNYCGSMKSDGRHVPSVIHGTAPAIDDLDSACKKHDQGIALNSVDRTKLDYQFAGDALRAALTPQSLKKSFFAVGAAAAVGAQGVARQLGFVNDGRVFGIAGGPIVFNIGPGTPTGHNPAEVSPHHFPILTMKRYARRNRKTYRARRRRSKPYAKRKVSKRRYNKKRSSYRSRRTTRRGIKHNYNYSSFVTEYGQSTADLNMVVCGHGTSGPNLLKVVCQSLVRSLFAKHGQMFSNFNELAQDTSNTDAFSYQMILFHQTSIADTALEEQIFSISTTDSYGDLSERLAAYILQESNTSEKALFLRYLELIQTDAGEANRNMVMAKVDLSRALLKWSFSSSIRIQNKTASGGNGANTDVNNVNPLEAKCYYGKYGKNFFDIYHKPNAIEALYRPWCPVSNYGAFDDTATAHSADESWLELPTKSMSGALKVKPFALHPGQVIVDNIGAKGTIAVNTLMVKLFSALCDVGAAPTVARAAPMALGVARAYGFEKLVWDRTEQQSATIGWEVNQRYGCTISYKKVRAAPIVDVFNNV